MKSNYSFYILMVAIAEILVCFNLGEKAEGIGNQGEELGEENFGHNYFEGDMILSEEQQKYLEGLKEGGKPQNTQMGSKRALIKDEKFLWPKRTVNYYFDDSVDEIGRKNTREAIDHWQDKTCLKFQETKDKDHIKFVFEGGCASRVGRGGGEQKLTIGDPALRCKTGNIIHELGHAVGFFHEHSRPDRDEFVHVVQKNIVPGYERNFYKFSTKFIDSRNVPYDYGSIMQYGRAFFSKMSLLLPTLETTKQNDEGEAPEIGQRVGLSELDILQANLLYNCDGKKRLTDDEREEIQSDMEDQLVPMDTIPCSDSYDQKSCLSIKNLGYCTKYPRTMRSACGYTCNMCSIQGKSAISRLKKQLKTKH